jgi:hypothetical protein
METEQGKPTDFPFLLCQERRQRSYDQAECQGVQAVVIERKTSSADGLNCV